MNSPWVHRSARIGWLLLGLCAFAFGLSHEVSDFRQDFSGKASDTSRIAASFGDTLKLGILRQEYRPIEYRLLTDGNITNGFSGTAGMAASRGSGQFEFAYVGWNAAHTTFSGSAPVADVRVRRAYLTDDSAGFETVSRAIAGNEMPSTVGNNRAPSHLFFDAAGSQYISYWSNLDNRTLRRTSDIAAAGGGAASGWGTDMPDNLEAIGAMGACLVPGSNARRSVLAIVSKIAGGTSTIRVRWEDLTANTSLTDSFTRSVTPEEFALAADSSGRSLVLWREGSNLYFKAYQANRATLQAPTLLSGISYQDAGAAHYYRSFHAVALRNGDFQTVYGRGNLIYSQRIRFTAGAATAMAPEVTLSRVGKTSFFPSVAANEKLAAMAWFEKQSASIHTLKAAVFNVNAGVIDTNSRINIDVAADSVGFTEVAAGWLPYHYFQTASVAIDPLGNLGIGYEDGYHAKAALVKYAAIYPDSGIFISKPLAVANPAAGFGYDALQDSVEYRPLEVVAGAAVEVRLAVAKDSNAFTPADNFRLLASPLRQAGGFFRYRVRLKTLDTAHLFTAKMTALTVPYNVKPRPPAVDSIRYAGGPWRAYLANDTTRLIRRRDSVELLLGGRDLDDADTLDFAVKLGDKILAAGGNAPKTASGRYAARFKFAVPDTSLPLAALSLFATDADGWVSNAGQANLRLINAPPTTAVSIMRHRGQDTSGQFFPNRGQTDTLALQSGDTVWVHRGDTLRVRVRVQDVNDDTLDLSFGKDGAAAVGARVGDGQSRDFIAIPPGTAGTTEAWTLVTADPDTALAFKINIRVNTPPVLDSLWLASYFLRDGSRIMGGRGIRDLTAKPELRVPAQVTSILKVRARDLDGDLAKPSYQMQLWHRPDNCAMGNRTCVSIVKQGQNDSLSVQVQSGDDQLAVRATDQRGAFTEAVVKLTYSLADTSSAQQYRSQVQLLDSALDFVMLSGITEKTVSVAMKSTGSSALQITSAKTSRNQNGHLEITLKWNDSAGKAQSQGFPKGSDQNPIGGSNAVLVPTGKDLTLQFRFFTDNLRGDTIFVDTLLLATNDLATPILRLPVRLIHRELPRLNILGSLLLDSVQSNGKPVSTSALPLAGGLRLAFSEAVLIPAASFLLVYSLLDSLANPKGYKPIPGQLTKRRATPGALGKSARLAYEAAFSRALARMGAAADSLADTLIFTPAYTKPSDSLKAMPLSGRFLHRDVLRVRVRNSATDPMGNAVDLRHERAKRAAGTFDTVFTVITDTTVLRLVRSEPAHGDSGISPDASWRLVFNRPLALKDPPEWTGLSKIDRVNLQGDENESFEARTSRTGRRPLNFSAITMGPGDSVLTIKMREKPAAYDTVTLTLSGSLSDAQGNTLDGDGDGFPAYLYDPFRGNDDLKVVFATGSAGFYVFPNPFRFDDKRHKAKGAVTFKNLNTLPGWKSNGVITLRIHDMIGNLVWRDNAHFSASQRRGRALIEWDLRNDRGDLVATNVYVYTLVDESDRLIIKGKVAIIR